MERPINLFLFDNIFTFYTLQLYAEPFQRKLLGTLRGFMYNRVNIKSKLKRVQIYRFNTKTRTFEDSCVTELAKYPNFRGFGYAELTQNPEPLRIQIYRVNIKTRKCASKPSTTWNNLKMFLLSSSVFSLTYYWKFDYLKGVYFSIHLYIVNSS